LNATRPSDHTGGRNGYDRGVQVDNLWGRSYGVRGFAPDHWPLNGVHGWGLGSRVEWSTQSEPKAALTGMAIGAAHWDETGWIVMIKRRMGREITYHAVKACEVRPAT
jgi:hypothetical protein